LLTSVSDTVVFEVSHETGFGVLSKVLRHNFLPAASWLSATLLAVHTHGRAAVSSLCPLLKTFTATDPTVTTVYESALRAFDGHRNISSCNLLNVDPSVLNPICLFSTTELRPFQIERVYRHILLINRPPLCIPERKRCDPPTQTVRPIATRPVHNIPPKG
jgi:hypothetical protein